jgi:rare lipoprotein A
VKINDRGPFIAGRIVDLSKAAAAEIDSVGDGVVPVTLRVVTWGTNQRIRAVDADDGATRAAATSSAPSKWAVQAGAFGNEENARRLCDRLAKKYAKAWIEDYEGLKRVKFGPYASRAEADAARDTLADLGLAGIVVPHR